VKVGSDIETWPFSEADWESVKAAALPVVNAELAEDELLRASHLVGLAEVLAGLRRLHGDHPWLVETEADFIRDDVERIGLYRIAIRSAEASGMQTLTIRLSLAEVLIGRSSRFAARAELLACEREANETDDNSDRAIWKRLSDAAREV